MPYNKQDQIKPVLNKSKSFFYNRYEELYFQSVNDPEAFWRDQAKRLDWIRFPESIRNSSFDPGEVEIKWYEDGILNVAVNCLDRHIDLRGEQPAIIWEGDDPAYNEVITYCDLLNRVNRLANALRSLGIKKGDVVTIYMPMVPEAAIAMLSCARIGAVHSVVFGGFSPEALSVRIAESGSRLVITADEGRRGGKIIPLKNNVDEALANENNTMTQSVIVVKVTGGNIDWQGGRDHWYHSLIESMDTFCEPVEMASEDPLFILYTSGSTGKPKGIKHTSGGYLVYASLTHEAVFDYKDGDIYWCTADVGWITGHSYIIYGPLANGATTLMFEGVPNYPDFDRFGKVIEKYSVKQFYTAPTAIRALMKKGKSVLGGSDLSSLEIIGTVGEPINPEAWEWYRNVFGRGECAVVDTWWQTETGGVMIVPLPGTKHLKPGSAMRPFFGIKPGIVDENGNFLDGEAEGNLVICASWPGQGRSCWGDHERFESTYFSTYPGLYFSGDGAKRDSDGDYWITGRVDDVMNVSGHRLGSAEIESALVANPSVAEAAVVGYPHSVKGEGIYVYVTIVDGIDASENLKKDLIAWVRKKIGPIASPDIIHWAPNLPKTRSGKIMRRILRKIASNDFSSFGDISTLADPSVVEDLVASRQV